MSLIEHAKREFKALNWPGTEESQKWICDNLIEMLEVFSKQGHSGSSAPYILDCFDRLARFKSLRPLTGEDSEWMEVCDGELWQNNRDSEVFKSSKDGIAYWISGIIFRDPDGSTWTNIESRVEISFPWTRPNESKIVDRPWSKENPEPRG